MAPVRRLIITTVEMSRKLTSKFPSGISETPLATVHTSRSSWTAVITSFSGFKCSQLRHSHTICPLIVISTRYGASIFPSSYSEPGRPPRTLATISACSGFWQIKRTFPFFQTNAVVIMIGVIDLPQNPSLPIHFQRGAAPVGSLSHVALVGNLAVVEQRPALGEISGLTGWVGHRPAVDDVAKHIDEVDGFVGARQVTEQREAREGALGIVAAQADAAAPYRQGLDCLLLRRGRNLPGRRFNRKTGHVHSQNSRCASHGEPNKLAAGGFHIDNVSKIVYICN